MKKYEQVVIEIIELPICNVLVVSGGDGDKYTPDDFAAPSGWIK